MKLIKVKLNGLTMDEFFEFVKQTKRIVDKYDTATLKIKNQADALVSSFADLQSAIDKEKGNAITKTINELDALRDKYISSFKKWLNAMEDYPNDTFAANATKYFSYIHQLSKNISRENALAETTLLNTIVEYFSLDATIKSNITAMGGIEWINAIETTNNNFAEAYSQRVTSNAENNNLPKYESARSKSKNLFNELVDIIKSRYQTAKADGLDVTGYQALINELNTLFTSTNTLVASTVARKPAITGAENKKG